MHPRISIYTPCQLASTPCSQKIVIYVSVFKPCDSGTYRTRSTASHSNQIQRYTVRYHQRNLFQYSERLSETLSPTTRYHQILPDPARSIETLSETVRDRLIQPTKCLRLPVATRHLQMLRDLSDAAKCRGRQLSIFSTLSLRGR